MNTNLMDAMTRFGIGLDPWFFEKHATAPNFPPHDIIQLGEHSYRLTLAVAGYAPDELQIVLENDLLTISGQKQDVGKEGHILHQGIAYRNFSRQFKIGEHVRVASATMEHGLLQIDLVREIPESQKPKLITISRH